MSTTATVLDSTRALVDTLRSADTLAPADSLARGGTSTPWLGVLIAVAIGVTLGLIYGIRK